jgi:WD40 repeat protein
MTKGSTHLSMVLAGLVSLLGAGLLACQTLKAWPDQKPESEPPAAAERPAQEGDKPARTDRYGDPLPPGALVRLGTVRWRHTTGLFRMAFTRDGKGLVTAGTLDPARLWDVASGRLLRQFDDWGTKGGNIVFSPDGRLVAGNVRSSGELVVLDRSSETNSWQRVGW